MPEGARKPTIPEVLPTFAAYRARVGAEWGWLHVVLADGNYEDSFVRNCVESAREAGDEEGAALAETLLRMSRTQRRKIATADYSTPRRA